MMPGCDSEWCPTVVTVNGIFVFHERITDINHVHFVPQHSTVRHAYNETKKPVDYHLF